MAKNKKLMLKCLAQLTKVADKNVKNQNQFKNLLSQQNSTSLQQNSSYNLLVFAVFSGRPRMPRILFSLFGGENRISFILDKFYSVVDGNAL